MKMLSDKRAIDKIYKRRNRYEIPEWQRQEVWSQSKKQSLIDSILRGWKLPKFYFLNTNEEPEEFEVVDGQQRLVSIFEFFDNELPLSPKSAEVFGANYYNNLPDPLADKFDDYEIEYDVIQDATEEEVKEFFQRLQEGLPLTSSEKLNSIHSKLRDFVAKLAKHPFFKNKVTVSDKRYGHFDIVAKVAAIEIDGINVGFALTISARFLRVRQTSLQTQMLPRGSKIHLIFSTSFLIMQAHTFVIEQSFKLLLHSLQDSLITAKLMATRRSLPNFLIIS
jgi:hypothetical protein